MMWILEVEPLINTPDGGLAATYAGFLSMVVSVLSVLGWKWVNKNKDKNNESLIAKIAKELDLENPESMIVKVNKMDAQLKTNGGSSMMDVVHKIHEDVAHLKSEHTSIKDQIEIVIASTRARTELALDQSVIAQFLANDKGEIDYVNDAMSELFGLGKHHFLKNKWLKIVESQTAREEIVRRLGFAVERKIDTTIDNIPCINNKEKRSFSIKITIEAKTDSKDRFLWYVGKIKEIIKQEPQQEIKQ
jgi:PAS domain-containing protein